MATRFWKMSPKLWEGETKLNLYAPIEPVHLGFFFHLWAKQPKMILVSDLLVPKWENGHLVSDLAWLFSSPSKIWADLPIFWSDPISLFNPIRSFEMGENLKLVPFCLKKKNVLHELATFETWLTNRALVCRNHHFSFIGHACPDMGGRVEVGLSWCMLWLGTLHHRSIANQAKSESHQPLFFLLLFIIKTNLQEISRAAAVLSTDWLDDRVIPVSVKTVISFSDRGMCPTSDLTPQTIRLFLSLDVIKLFLPIHYVCFFNLLSATTK